MKQNYTSEDRVDDLFRKTLEEHRVEPDPAVWKGLSRKLLWHEVLRLNFSNLARSYWKLGLICGLTALLAFYLALPEKSSKKDPETAKSSPNNIVKGENSVVSQTVASVSLERAEVKSGQVAPAGSSVPVQEETTGKSSAADAAGTVSGSKRSAARETKYPVLNSGSTRDNPDAGESVNSNATYGQSNESMAELSHLKSAGPGLSYLIPARITCIRQDNQDTIITIHTTGGNARFAFPKGRSPHMFTLKVGILPEVAFYSGAEKYNKSNYWIHTGVGYHISRFSLSSGIELGYMLDNGKYRVDYKSEDSIGYFSNVVSYTIGSNNELLFNTQNQAIYDSIMHTDDYRTSDRYTYLRVPLLLGYRLSVSDRFSIGIHAGPAISFLLGTRKSDPVIEYANARIIRIDEETPARMKTNWQLWGNLLMELKITRKVGLYLEPSFKYFMKPTAEQESPDAKPPWSFGLGVGLQFNFEPKKKNQ